MTVVFVQIAQIQGKRYKEQMNLDSSHTPMVRVDSRQELVKDRTFRGPEF